MVFYRREAGRQNAGGCCPHQSSLLTKAKREEIIITKQITKGKLACISIGTFLMMYCTGIVTNSTTHFIVQVTEYLNCSRAEFSVYYTIVTATFAIASLFVGQVQSKLGLRKTIILATIGTPLGFLIMSRLTALWMVYVGAFFIGTFQAFIVIPVVGTVTAWFKKNSGVFIGIAMSATGVAGIVMGQLMPRIVSNVSWRTGYLICAAMFFLVSVVANALAGGRYPEEDIAQAAGDSNALTKDSSAYRRWARSPWLWAILYCAFMGSGASMILQHFTAHVGQVHNMDAVTAGTVLSIYNIGLTVFKPVEGAVVDKIGGKIFIPITFGLGALGYLALTVPSIAMLAIGIILFGWLASANTVFFPLCMRHLMGQKVTTLLWGWCWAAFQFANSVWAPFYGWTYDISGSYNLGLVVGAIAIFTVMVALMFVWRKGDKLRAAGEVGD